MRISKASWHYRFSSWVWHTPPKDLCAYVRCLVVACVIAPLVFPLLGLMIAWNYIAAGFAWVGSKIIDSLPERPQLVEPSQPVESLWRAWLRAKKQKVCPLVEFTNADSNRAAESLLHSEGTK